MEENAFEHVVCEMVTILSRGRWVNDILSLWRGSQPWSNLNIKIPSYQWRDSHCKDKTVSCPRYLNHGIPCTLKDGHDIKTEIGVWLKKIYSIFLGGI